MTTATTKNIFFGRSDTMLGICEAVGRDLGFHPNWLRAGLGMSLMFNPVLVISIYLGLGVAVLASRLVFPTPRAATASAARTIEAPAVAARNDVDTRELALAA